MIRQTTTSLFQACALDMPVSPAGACDFGIDGWGGTDPNAVYAAYQSAIKGEKISIEQLDKALGDGPALTELIGVAVKTVWDETQ